MTTELAKPNLTVKVLQMLDTQAECFFCKDPDAMVWVYECAESETEQPALYTLQCHHDCFARFYHRQYRAVDWVKAE